LDCQKNLLALFFSLYDSNTQVYTLGGKRESEKINKYQKWIHTMKNGNSIKGGKTVVKVGDLQDAAAPPPLNDRDR